jgi:phytoene desaturase
LITLPHLFDARVRDRLTMVRLDPQFQYFWRDGDTLTVADAGTDRAGYREFVSRGRRIWDISERTFFAGPMSNPLSLVRRMRSPRDLVEIDAMRTLARAAADTFTDPHMRQWAGRYATYSGSSPFRVPATLACIPAVESQYGCWYPLGGLGALRDALVDSAAAAGADLRTGAEVTRVAVAGGRVSGVELADGTRLATDVVIANIDAEYLYRDLLPHPRSLRRVQRAARSTSGFVVLAGVRGTTPGIGHHNVWFSDDSSREFAALAAGRFAEDPTVYGCVSSVTDDSQAPAGHENWFLLVNAPTDGEVDAAAYQQVVLDRLADQGHDIRDRLLFTETMTPADIAERYRAPGGSIYGSSSNGRRAAFVRPGNRGAVPGLYLVGGSSHPGGGLPLVTMSAHIVVDMIDGDLA